MQTEQASAENPTDSLDFSKHTVMVVDDSTSTLGVVFEYLDELGFDLMIAQDGGSGLERVAAHKPDIILLDAMMPEMDGYEMCRRLKANDSTRDIPVIFMTGLTSVEDKVLAFEVGAVDYVTKPIRKRELVARIVSHLQIRNLTRQLTEHRLQLEQKVRQRTRQLKLAQKRLTEVEEFERKQLARELHDRVGQDLGLLDVHLNILRQEISAETSPLLQARFQDIFNLLGDIAGNVYSVMAELRSPVLADYGLIAALNAFAAQYAQHTGLEPVVIGDDDAPRVVDSAEIALFRICQEALTNISKYAQAQTVTIEVAQSPAAITMTISDDGVGFDPAEWQTPNTEGKGWGLLSMRERAEALDGRFDVASARGQGTQLTITIPL